MTRCVAIKCFVFLFLILLIGSAYANEITVFDEQGKAAAYVDTNEDATIFLWSGKPVAYIHGRNIYGFNGKHLGWLDQGVFRDHGGYVTGFFEGAAFKMTELETLKGVKQLMPLKSLRQMEPLRPLFSNQWSQIPLELFLLNGITGE